MLIIQQKLIWFWKTSLFLLSLVGKTFIDLFVVLHRFGMHVQALQQGSKWTEDNVWVYEFIPTGARQSPCVRGGRGKEPCWLHPGKI